MKPIVLLVPAIALTLAACGSTEIKESRETVIERPVITQTPREIVVERPVQPLRSCAYGTGIYSSGTVTCQAGYQYQCVDGAWNNRGVSC